MKLARYSLIYAFIALSLLATVRWAHAQDHYSRHYAPHIAPHVTPHLGPYYAPQTTVIPRLDGGYTYDYGHGSTIVTPPDPMGRQQIYREGLYQDDW